MDHIVIVGAGLAGHRCALALRKEGFDGRLTLVGDERHKPYDRPPLSKQVLSGAWEHSETFFKHPEDVAVDFALGSAAVSLDVDGRVVTLADGSTLSYDGLVIATGRGARPWFSELGLDGVHVLRSLDDCAAFSAAVAEDTRVVIVGAGFIGCEVAATLHGRGVASVSVVDVLPQPLAPLGLEIGAWVAEQHRERGIDFRLSAKVASFEGSGSVSAVSLEGGTVLPADVVLLALGSVPNSEWLADSGLELDRGNVVVDEHLFAVGREDVLAIGDIAAWPGADGSPTCIEHWTNAREMASVAAVNLLGGREVFRSVPTFWSDQANLKIKSCGWLAGAAEIKIVDVKPEKPSLVAEALDADGNVVGAITVNRNKSMIEYTRELTQALAAS